MGRHRQGGARSHADADGVERLNLRAGTHEAARQLQEAAQDRLKLTPRYQIVSEVGPDHEKIFEVEVMLGSDVYARATGRRSPSQARWMSSGTPRAEQAAMMARSQIDAAKGLGYDAFAATELEHYLFRKSYREAQAQDFRDLSPAGWYLEDYHILQGTRTEDYHAAVRRHLRNSGVPVTFRWKFLGSSSVPHTAS